MIDGLNDIARFFFGEGGAASDILISVANSGVLITFLAARCACYFDERNSPCSVLGSWYEHILHRKSTGLIRTKCATIAFLLLLFCSSKSTA